MKEKKVGKKAKAFFSGLAQPNTSEFWMMWGGVVMNLLGYYPPVRDVIIGMASSIGVDPAVFVGGMLVYGVGRMTSKAAKA